MNSIIRTLVRSADSAEIGTLISKRVAPESAYIHNHCDNNLQFRRVDIHIHTNINDISQERTNLYSSYPPLTLIQLVLHIHSTRKPYLSLDEDVVTTLTERPQGFQNPSVIIEINFR